MRRRLVIAVRICRAVISGRFFFDARRAFGRRSGISCARAARRLPESADKKYCSKVLAKSAKVG
jgi:hypothetical protein